MVYTIIQHQGLKIILSAVRETRSEQTFLREPDLTRFEHKSTAVGVKTTGCNYYADYK